VSAAVHDTNVVLWDIDGTLLRSAGMGVRVFASAVERVTGSTWTPQWLDLGGRTDPDIALMMLGSMGIDDPRVTLATLDAVVAGYGAVTDELAALVTVLPGVHETIDALADRGALQTIVTGNLRAGADAKLVAAGLGQHLRLDLGAYGSDPHTARVDLVRLAIERVVATGVAVDPDRTWVIGDTPRDLECARAAGVRCALVRTGVRSDADPDLGSLGADLLLDDLTDPAPLLNAMA